MTVHTIPEHNLVVGLAGPYDDAQITAETHNRTTTYFHSTGNKHMVANDRALTMSGVVEYADAGATRAVTRHLGPALGYPASTAPSLIRASEHQTLRGLGTEGGAWGMEVGLHSQVLGDGVSKNLGIYVASSHTGWLPSGVRNDVGILVCGEDGWHHGFRYLDRDGATVLADIDYLGNLVLNGRVASPNTPFFRGSVQGTCTTGNDALLANIEFQGFAYDHGGVGGGTRITAPVTGVYEINAGVNSPGNNTQMAIFKNGVTTNWGAAGNVGSIGMPTMITKLNAGDIITLRCLNGSFGANAAFSHFSMRPIG